MPIDLGTLTTVNPRDAWANEARDFTPWLAQPENLLALGIELGLEFELVGTEVPVGPYWADILARDTTHGRNVVIENQLEKTDHDHLGKALTYGAILDASVVIWIAKRFTDEHRKTLDWLNDHSDEDLELYGICIELWKVGESLPAPRFNVVSRPASVVKQARSGAKEELSETRQLQLEFWTDLRDRLQETGEFSSLQTPRPQYWFEVAMGRTGIYLSNIANTSDNKIGVRVYLSHKVVDAALPQLLEEKSDIENELGFPLAWNPNPDNRDKIIMVDQPADLSQRSEWEAYLTWMTETIVAMNRVFRSRVKNLDLSQPRDQEQE